MSIDECDTFSAIYEAISDNFGLDHDRIYDAIREGVSDAVWKIATNATIFPCSDFYHHIKEGTREAIEKVGCNCKVEDDF